MPIDTCEIEAFREISLSKSGITPERGVYINTVNMTPNTNTHIQIKYLNNL